MSEEDYILEAPREGKLFVDTSGVANKNNSGLIHGDEGARESFLRVGRTKHALHRRGNVFVTPGILEELSRSLEHYKKEKRKSRNLKSNLRDGNSDLGVCRDRKHYQKIKQWVTLYGSLIDTLEVRDFDLGKDKSDADLGRVADSILSYEGLSEPDGETVYAAASKNGSGILSGDRLIMWAYSNICKEHELGESFICDFLAKDWCRAVDWNG